MDHKGSKRIKSDKNGSIRIKIARMNPIGSNRYNIKTNQDPSERIKIDTMDLIGPNYIKLDQIRSNYNKLEQNEPIFS